VIVAEARRQDIRQHAEGVVDAQRIGGLAEADARDVKGRAPLDQDRFDAALRKGCGRGQSTDAAADHQDAPDRAHQSAARPLARIGPLQRSMPPRMRSAT
jgi:hypothetical protein